MRRRWVLKLRQFLLRATVLALACNFVVPAGYMPAALADGAPFALCGFGFQSLGQMGHGAHHDHHADHTDGSANADTDSGSPEDAWEYCPLGALSASSAVTSDFFLLLEDRKAHFQANPEFTSIVPRPVMGFLSRAPPTLETAISLI